MTPKELFERLQTELKSMTWGSTANKIFGEGVYIVSPLPIQNIDRWPNVCCFLVGKGFVNDPEHPGIGIQNFSITVFVENVFDALSSGGIVGANRVADTSAGAGILDIEKELISKLIKIVQLVSRALIIEKSFPEIQGVKNNFPLILKSFACSALVGVYS